jgi:aldose 1-epimerase
VEFLQGYRFAQIYAQPGLDYICLEPMTAPANALVTGEQLPIVEIGERFRAKFRIAVCDTGDGAPLRPY